MTWIKYNGKNKLINLDFCSVIELQERKILLASQDGNCKLCVWHVLEFAEEANARESFDAIAISVRGKDGNLIMN